MSFDVTLTIQDGFARRTTRRFTNTRAAIADAISDVAVMIDAVEALSAGAVVKSEIGQVTNYSTNPTGSANLDGGATIHVRLDNGKLYPLHIPAFELSKVEADGSIVVSDEDVQAFTYQFGSSGHWTVSEGNTVASVESAELDR